MLHAYKFKKVTIYKTEPDANSIFPKEILIYDGYLYDKSEYFNLSMLIPNLLTSDEICKIRNYLENKNTKLKTAFIYASEKWMD